MNLNRREFALTALGAVSALAFSPSWAAQATENRRWVLASRPNGKPTLENFRLETVAVPAVGDGEVLLQQSFSPWTRICGGG